MGDLRVVHGDPADLTALAIMSVAEFKRLEGSLRDSTRLVSNINKIHDRLSKVQSDQQVFDPATERECLRLAEMYEEAIRSSEEEEKCSARAAKILANEFGLGQGGGGGKKAAPSNNFYDDRPTAGRNSFGGAPKSARTSMGGGKGGPGRPSMGSSMHKQKPPASTDKPKKILPTGTQVACKIVQYGMDPSWILASVMEFVGSTKKYRVKDDDPGESFSQEYLAPWRNVVALAEETAIVDAGEKVLAIYPDSTMFYQATVVKAPVDAHDDYTLFFDGDQSQVRMVNGHYVFANRE